MEVFQYDLNNWTILAFAPQKKLTPFQQPKKTHAHGANQKIVQLNRSISGTQKHQQINREVVAGCSSLINIKWEGEAFQLKGLCVSNNP